MRTAFRVRVCVCEAFINFMQMHAGRVFTKDYREHVHIHSLRCATKSLSHTETSLQPHTYPHIEKDNTKRTHHTGHRPHITQSPMIIIMGTVVCVLHVWPFSMRKYATSCANFPYTIYSNDFDFAIRALKWVRSINRLESRPFWWNPAVPHVNTSCMWLNNEKFLEKYIYELFNLWIIHMNE